MILKVRQFFGSGTVLISFHARKGTRVSEYLASRRALETLSSYDEGLSNDFFGYWVVPDAEADRLGIATTLWADPGPKSGGSPDGFEPVPNFQFVSRLERAGLGTLPIEQAVAEYKKATAVA